MSIMLNSSKTPTGKAKKGQVTIRLDSGSIKACFPRPYFPGEAYQVKIATGISNVDGWKTDADTLQRRLQLEIEEGKLSSPGGKFNRKRYFEILVEYKLKPDLKIVESAVTSDGQLPPKPEMSLMEVWDMYCEYIKPRLKETTFAIRYESTYTNFIKDAISATKSEDAVKIRNWLIKNRNIRDVKFIVTKLFDAYNLALRNNLTAHNPYNGLAEEITIRAAKGKTKDEIETETDNEVLNQSKAYTWDEAQIILDYIENVSTKKHWHEFIKFKFLTGCRTGEAIAFMWGDINWAKQCIYIRRNYNYETKKFYNLKNAIGEKEIIRVFPMPENGELWKLLKSIPQGEPNDTVFKSKNKGTINDATVRRIWRGGTTDGTKGIITELIKNGKLTKYLPCYNTRHTFISHQIFDLGRDEKVVSAWCGHGEAVNQKHYQDIADRAMQINPDLPANQQSQQQQSEIEILKEQLRQQQEAMKQQHELINKLLQGRDK